MSYILLDESGDLGFSFDKNSSQFFIVTLLFSKSLRPIEKIAKKVHATLRKKYKKVGVLHTYNEEPITRQRVLRKIDKADCNIMAIVLNKRKVYAHLQNEKAVLYNYVINIWKRRWMDCHTQDEVSEILSTPKMTVNDVLKVCSETAELPNANKPTADHLANFQALYVTCGSIKDCAGYYSPKSDYNPLLLKE